jgi:hypothetical protein
VTRRRRGSPCARGHARREGATFCPTCCREDLLAAVITADASLDAEQITAAFAETVTSPRTLHSLSEAVTVHGIDVLHVGAPGTVTRLVTALRARGSTTFPAPCCAACGRTDRVLAWTEQGARCPNCRRRQTAQPCHTCAVIKPVAGRTSDGQPLCARCAPRPRRRCGRCDRVRVIARRAHDGQPDICDACFRGPEATCSVCARRRPCNFATTSAPVCTGCTSRPLRSCARCHTPQPVTAVWPEGPVCERCYTSALRTRATCHSCGQQRRLVVPHGPDATTCSDCAGLPATHTCSDCGVEDKLYERGRCDRCALRRRVTDLLATSDGDVPAALVPVVKAICDAPVTRSALNWLRQSASAELLGDIAAGRLPLTHATLDGHPHPRAAAYLRGILTAHGALPARDEDLARFERWLPSQLERVTQPADRRILHAYATWHVAHRLRRRAARNPRPRTATSVARQQIRTAVAFLAWLPERGTPLAAVAQDDIDAWVLTSPGAATIGDFLDWTAEHGHTTPLTVEPTPSRTATAMPPDTRWATIRRLLHDDTLNTPDRVAGCLVLLYGQHLTRITALTHHDLTRTPDQLTIRLGDHGIDIPEPLAGLITTLADTARHPSIAATPSPWLFPGLHPGRPLSPAHLGTRLRNLGVPSIPGRRAALVHLAATLPAAVLADLLGLHPTTAVKWINNANGNWNTYAAALLDQAPTNP